MYNIITPVVTLFDNTGKIDFESNRNMIDFLISNGVDGILVLGSTGEFTYLNNREKEELFKFYYEYTNGRVPLYAGTGTLNLEETITLSNNVIQMGYKGVFVIGPYYYALDQEKIYIYYDKIAKSIKGNLYLYNYPARTGHSINKEALEMVLKNNTNIKGLKDSVTEPNHTNQLMSVVKDKNFEMYSGFDDQYLYNVSMGGTGSIGGLSNVVPDIWSSLVTAVRNNDFNKCVKLSRLIQKLMPIYEVDVSPALVLKKLAIHRGVKLNPTTQFPYNKINEEKYENIVKVLDDVLEEFKEIK
ncbi:dihydrodipicolinate synthase family protein [Fusobacterium sp. PH5-44]|uniref:dihydrodipicolinate synthase family protein n=1 Tax=unclassified Fusobacterium TaxID=2648384 RepID=UPI003D235D5B